MRRLKALLLCSSCYTLFSLFILNLESWDKYSQEVPKTHSNLPQLLTHNTTTSDSFRHYKHTVDVLSFGSQTRPDYQEAQKRTWASHGSIRYFFGIDERFDADQECFTSLTPEDIYSISDFCRRKKRRVLIRDKPLSVLEDSQAGNYAGRKWLAKKPFPVGWMCNIPRPVFGLEAAASFYDNHEMPDYLIITDDDTFFNMEMFHQLLQNRSSTDPEGWAGCLVRTPPYQLINFTFSHGGFGLTLSKGALQNLVKPIHCDVATTPDEFDRSVCNRLKDPLLNEAKLFEPGMRLIDLMVAFVSYQRYSAYKNWTDGFCQHGDWIFGYFLNYYNLTNHIANSSPNAWQRQMAAGNPFERIHEWGEIYRRVEGNCAHEGTCAEDALVCHKQTPPMMDELDNRTSQNAPLYAFAPRIDPMQRLQPKLRG